MKSTIFRISSIFPHISNITLYFYYTIRTHINSQTQLFSHYSQSTKSVGTQTFNSLCWSIYLVYGVPQLARLELSRRNAFPKLHCDWIQNYAYWEFISCGIAEFTATPR
ncbi:hypothetical protein CEXT_762861 [Caerostris extrusa]|uniref:Uncharacterized protein n=1 Tax=Caerostris extrusa TaxID=172846 RepID=A0AAV4S8L3_CAEEX|nr:hypothetical protein CEXT_762861 [Caerostris extrusa]